MLQSGFRALQLALCAASLVVLWNSVSPLARGITVAGLPPLGDARTENASRPLGDYEAIGSRNLFGAAEVVKVAAPVVAIEPSRLQVRLMGTVAAASPELSVGIVREASQSKADVVRIGQKVAGGQATVVQIEQRRMIIDHGGRLESIVVEDVKPSLKGKAPPRDASRNQDRMRALIQERQQDREKKLAAQQPSQAPVELDMSGGAPTGIQIQQVSPESLLGEIGVQPGDRIVSVNGARIGDPAAIAQIAQVGGDQPKMLEIERNGSTTQVEVPPDKARKLLRDLGLAP